MGVGRFGLEIATALGVALLLASGCGRTALDDESPHHVAGSSAANTGGAGKGGSTPLAGAHAGGAPVSGGSGGVVEGCRDTALEIRNARVVDTTNDGRYSPGEQIRVVAELATLGKPTTALLSVVADDPALELVNGLDNDFFELEPGKPVPIAVTFVSPRGWAGSEYVLQLRLTSADRPDCFAPVQQQLPITLTTEDRDLLSCQLTRQLQLSNPRIADGNGDGRVLPGEDFNLLVTLTNRGPIDGANGYPGMTVAASDPGIETVSEGHHFAIGIQSIQLSWGMRAQANVMSGAQVLLTLTPSLSSVRCLDAEPIEYWLTID